MKSVEVGIRKLHPAAIMPRYMTSGASGADLAASEAEVIPPGKRRIVKTGLAIEIPDGYEAQVRPRSGLAAKHLVSVLNSPGSLDADFRGEVCVILINHGTKEFIIQPGDRIAQLVIAPVVQGDFVVKEELSETVRDAGGFGHTGI